MFYKEQVLIKLFCIFISIKCVQSALLYPQYTVMQLIGSISTPIMDLPQDRKVFFDWGFQMNYDMPFNVSSFYMVPIWSAKSAIKTRAVHKHDFTAKEIYEGLENMLERYGYDRSCLKQSICELSQYAFDEAHTNLATDVIDFILKPSLHQSFSTKEKEEETLYRLAEDQGIMGKNCHELYPKCFNNLFNILTKKVK